MYKKDEAIWHNRSCRSIQQIKQTNKHLQSLQFLKQSKATCIFVLLVITWYADQLGCKNKTGKNQAKNPSVRI